MLGERAAQSNPTPHAAARDTKGNLELPAARAGGRARYGAQ